MNEYEYWEHNYRWEYDTNELPKPTSDSNEEQLQKLLDRKWEKSHYIHKPQIMEEKIQAQIIDIVEQLTKTKITTKNRKREKERITGGLEWIQGKETGIQDMASRPMTHRDIGKDNISSKSMTGETEWETVQGRKM